MRQCGVCPIKQQTIEDLRREVAVLYEQLRKQPNAEAVVGAVSVRILERIDHELSNAPYMTTDQSRTLGLYMRKLVTQQTATLLAELRR